jgi:hypothetical protein
VAKRVRHTGVKMKTGQFYRGKIDGIQKNFESPDIDKILPPSKLTELADLDTIGEYPQFNRQTLTLILSIVTAAENTDGRRGGIVNHTVFYSWDRTVTHEDAVYLFDVEKFVSEIQAGKRRFKMPPIPNYPENVDFAIIEPPPPITWEAKP